MCWTYFKTVGHCLKNVSPSQKTLFPLVSQAGYGPGTKTHLQVRLQWTKNGNAFPHQQSMRTSFPRVPAPLHPWEYAKTQFRWKWCGSDVQGMQWNIPRLTIDWFVRKSRPITYDSGNFLPFNRQNAVSDKVVTVWEVQKPFASTKARAILLVWWCFLSSLVINVEIQTISIKFFLNNKLCRVLKRDLFRFYRENTGRRVINYGAP